MSPSGVCHFSSSCRRGRRSCAGVSVKLAGRFADDCSPCCTLQEEERSGPNSSQRPTWSWTWKVSVPSPDQHGGLFHFPGQPGPCANITVGRVRAGASRASRASQRLKGIATMIIVAKICKAFRKTRSGAVLASGASPQGIAGTNQCLIMASDAVALTVSLGDAVFVPWCLRSSFVCYSFPPARQSLVVAPSFSPALAPCKPPGFCKKGLLPGLTASRALQERGSAGDQGSQWGAWGANGGSFVAS